MLARLGVLLPFPVAIPENETFSINSYEDQGYRVVICQPGKSDSPVSGGVDQITIGGVPAFEANALRIEFYRESFDRSVGGPHDPPDEVVVRAISSFLARLRHVTKAFQIRRTEYPNATWRFEYLNDDGTELEPKEGFVRGRGGLRYEFGRPRRRPG